MIYLLYCIVLSLCAAALFALASPGKHDLSSDRASAPLPAPPTETPPAAPVRASIQQPGCFGAIYDGPRRVRSSFVSKAELATCAQISLARWEWACCPSVERVRPGAGDGPVMGCCAALETRHLDLHLN